MDDPPSPREEWALTPEAFDRMLSWLDSDRDQAGERYEEIRVKLMKRFRQHGVPEPEDLTNRTFDRVAKTLPRVIAIYKGDQEPYFFSVAYYVYKEYLKRPIIEALANLDFEGPPNEDNPEREWLDSCLRHCLEKLAKGSRELILEYYRCDRDSKVKTKRKALADRLQTSLPNLRLKAQRIRSVLKSCILDCMERKTMERQTFM